MDLIHHFLPQQAKSVLNPCQQIYSPVLVLMREIFGCTVMFMSVFWVVSDLEVEFMLDYNFDVILALLGVLSSSVMCY